MSKVQRQLRGYSIQMNVQSFLKDYTALECFNLSMYLGGRFMDDVPTDQQKKFIDEFFGLTDWFTFIDNEKKDAEGKGRMLYRPSFDLAEIRAVVMYITVQRIPDLLTKVNKLDQEITQSKIKRLELEIKLIGAVQESYEDGIFDKCDGWCNVSDVLVADGLLKLPKEDE